MLIIRDAPFFTWDKDGPSFIQISSQIFIPTPMFSYQNNFPGSLPFEKYLASSKTE